MTYSYAVGCVRAKRWRGEGDVRGCPGRRGWSLEAVLTDVHPISGHRLRSAQWWIVESFNGQRER
jgi:hypothetical protein